MSSTSAMFLTTRAKEVKNTKKSASGRSCTSSESVEWTLPFVRPSFSFDVLMSTPNAAEKCPEIDSKGLEFHIRRCRELKTVNQQLNERPIESESQHEEYRTEMEGPKYLLAEALKIPSAMLFPGKSTQATMKDNVQELQDLAPQRCVLAVQLPDGKESGSKGVGVKLTDLEERVKFFESRCVRELDVIKNEIEEWGGSKDANERCSCASFDEQRLEEVELHIKNFTLLVHQNATKLQALLRPASPQGAFINAQHKLLEKNESSSTLEASLDCPMSSESITVQKSSLICDLREEDGDSMTQVLNPQGLEDSVKELQNQPPRIPLHVIETQTPSLNVDINDSARNLEEYPGFNSACSNLGARAEARLHLDSMSKENNELRREIIRISEELVDIKEHSVKLEAELKDQRDASGRCKMMEMNLRRVQDSNRDLNNALFRNQKIVTSLKTALTNLHSEAKQHCVYNATPGTEIAPQLNTKICTQVNAVLEAEICYSKMERLITTAQTERDCLASRLIALDGQARCLQRKYLRRKREMNAIQKENSSLKRALSCARSEIRTLQTNLRVETMKLISRRRRTRSSLDADGDVVMKELVKTKVALAEMHGVVIELRKEICNYRSSGAVARNTKPCSSRLKQGTRTEIN